MIVTGNDNALLTIIAIHGFSSNASEMRNKYDHLLPSNTRRVYLNAPLRRISCYDGAWHRSWHDYHTNYGDLGIEMEEKIDASQLIESSTRVHSIASRFKDMVVVMGESQGACVAIDVAMRYGHRAISLFGQRYAVTPLNLSRVDALIGGWDTIIPKSVAYSSLSTLRHCRIRVIAKLSHAEVDDVKVPEFLKEIYDTIPFHEGNFEARLSK
jgi:predicted esterase